jgi:hypothetical protein
MPLKEKVKHILIELKGHTPFTILGALLGILFMLLFKNISSVSNRNLFAMFHPGHVLLSAMVTASMFGIHASKKRFILVLIVGYFGSVGVATLSDVVIPHIGSRLLGLNIPTHAELHHHETAAHDEHHHQHSHIEDEHQHKNYSSEIHLGFIEEWYLVTPAALIGILIAYFLPRTKFPHTGHVLVSTWASSSYLLMNIGSEFTIAAAIGIFVTLFIAIWLPCCISDIVFPLLFVKSDIELAAPCPVHGLHSHDHLQKPSENSK